MNLFKKFKFRIRINKIVVCYLNLCLDWIAFLYEFQIKKKI